MSNDAHLEHPSFQDIKMNVIKEKLQLDEVLEELKQGIEDLYESERYKNYLTVLSRFHSYSANNCLLIAMQKPDATYVAGYTAWKKNFGRQVRKGEKAIKILAPAPYKVRQKREKIDLADGKPILKGDGTPVTEEYEVIVPAYKIANCFDISQTEGRELPSLVHILNGSVEDYSLLFDALQRVSPVPISFENIESSTNGYYHLGKKHIVIRTGMGQQQNIKTLIHEISHAKLHDWNDDEGMDKLVDRGTAEVQAESVAYVVAQHYGIDTSEYSFGYIAGWSKSKQLDELRESLQTIRSCSGELIDQIDKVLLEIQSKTLEKKETVVQAITSAKVRRHRRH